MYRILSAGIIACVSSLVLTASTEPGIIWDTKNFDKDRVNFTAIASNGGARLIAVGEGGAIRASDDQGVTWTNKDSNVHFDLNGITWTGTRWVAVGGFFRDVSMILSSTDGEEWATTCLAGRPVLRGVAASPTTTVAVGDLELTARTGPYGGWITATDTSSFFNDIVWTGSQFVVVGSDGRVKTSPDGTTWTLRTTGLTDDLFLTTVAWNGTTLVAAGFETTAYTARILTSSDGISWTPASLTGLPDFNLKNMAWTGSRFVTMGVLGHILTSPDGMTWSYHQTPGFIDPSDLCWDGSRLIVVGRGGAVIYTDQAAPDESSDWTFSSVPDETYQLNDLTTGDVAGGQRAVVVGNYGTILSSDNEFQNTTPRTSGITSTLHGITATTLPSSRFLAVGSGGVILTSSDAVTWTPRASGTTWQLNAVAWFIPGGLVFPLAIAVGNEGTIVTSNNTVTWTPRTSGYTRPLLDVAAGRVFAKPDPIERIVAVGEDGAILYSSNGTTWTKVVDSGTTEHLLAVAAMDYGFAAIGTHGVALTSANGINWTKQDDISTYRMYDLTWTGNQLVAVGTAGMIFTSPTGVQWTRRYGPGSTDLLGITTLNTGKVAAVGMSERIITSDRSTDFPDWIAGEGPPSGEDDPEDDPNGDRITNLMAYGLGIPAVAPSSTEDIDRLPIMVQPAMGRPFLVRLGPSRSETGDLAYIVEVSTTLRPDGWTEVLRHLPGQLCGSGSIDVIMSGSSPSNNVFLAFPETIGDRKGYFARLRVEQVP